MSAYFNTQKQQGFRDFIPQQSGKGRIGSVSSISRQLIKAHYDGYHPRMSRQLATALKRYINTRPKYERRTPEFVEEIKRKILCLHEYNLQIAKVKFKYPRSEQFDVVLMQYVELECGLLYDTYSDVDKEHENHVTQRVLRLLRVILHESLQNGDTPLKTTLQTCDKALLKLFVNVRADYVSENKLVANTITKLLHKLNLLEDVDKLKGKNIAFQEDTFLRNPLVCSIRQNLATSDYESDMDDDDDDLMTNEPFGNSALSPQGLFSHLDEKVNIMRASKNFDILPFKFGSTENHLSPLLAQQMQKEHFGTSYHHRIAENNESLGHLRNLFDDTPETRSLGVSDKPFQNRASALRENTAKFLHVDSETNLQNDSFSTSRTSFLKHSLINNKLNKHNVPSTFSGKQSSEINEDFFLATESVIHKETTKESSFPKNNSVEKNSGHVNGTQHILTTKNPYDDSFFKRTDNIEKARSSIVEDIEEKRDVQIATPNVGEKATLNDHTVTTAHTNKSVVSSFDDCEIIELDEDSCEAFSGNFAVNIKSEVPSSSSASEEFHCPNIAPVVASSSDSSTINRDFFPNSSNNQSQTTENVNGGIITIEIFDDEDDYTAPNATEGLSQFETASHNLLQSNEIKQEENEENRSPNFSIPISDNDDQNFWSSGKSSRSSNSSGVNRLGKSTNKDSTREADASAVVISDSEDEVPNESACDEELRHGGNKLSEQAGNEEERGKNNQEIEEEIQKKNLGTEDSKEPLEADVAEPILSRIDQQNEVEIEISDETSVLETNDHVQGQKVAEITNTLEYSSVDTSEEHLRILDLREDSETTQVITAEEPEPAHDVDNEETRVELLIQGRKGSNKQDTSHLETSKDIDQAMITDPQIEKDDESETNLIEEIVANENVSELDEAITNEGDCLSEQLRHETNNVETNEPSEVVDFETPICVSEASTVSVEVDQLPVSEVSVDCITDLIPEASKTHENEIIENIEEVVLPQESQIGDLEAQNSDNHLNLEEMSEKESVFPPKESKEVIGDLDQHETEIGEKQDLNVICTSINEVEVEESEVIDFGQNQGETCKSSEDAYAEISRGEPESVDEIKTYDTDCATVTNEFSVPIESEVTSYVEIYNEEEHNDTLDEPTVENDAQPILKDTDLEEPEKTSSNTNDCKIDEMAVNDEQTCTKEMTSENKIDIVEANPNSIIETKQLSPAEDIKQYVTEDVAVNEIQESLVSEDVGVPEEINESCALKVVERVEEIKEAFVAENVGCVEEIKESSFSENVETIEEIRDASDLQESSISESTETVEKTNEFFVSEKIEIVEEVKESCVTKNADSAEIEESISHNEIAEEVKEISDHENGDTTKEKEETRLPETPSVSHEIAKEVIELSEHENVDATEEKEETHLPETPSVSHEIAEEVIEFSEHENVDTTEEKEETHLPETLENVKTVKESLLSDREDLVTEPQKDLTADVPQASNECVEEVPYVAIDYSVSAQYPQQPSEPKGHMTQSPHEDSHFQHNLPIFKISDHMSNVINTQACLVQKECENPHLSLYEVEYSEYNVQKKVGGDLELLANIAADQETLAVKTDSEKEIVDTPSDLEGQIKLASQSTPRRRKSKVKFDNKKKTLARETLPRAVKGPQRRNLPKQKPNPEEAENKRVTRNMGIKPRADVNVLKEVQKPRTNRNDDSKYKPHDFISMENSILPPRTNNVYAQKRLMETNTTSEDSNDSCESTLFIDLGENQRHSEKIVKSVFEEDTICDMLEFVTTEDKATVCISIPEDEENCVSDSFRILKQMEDFVDNNNKETSENVRKLRGKKHAKVVTRTREESNANQTSPEDLSVDSSQPKQGEESKVVKTTDHSIKNILNKTPSNGEVKIPLQTYHGELEFHDGITLSDEEVQPSSQKTAKESKKRKSKISKVDETQTYNIPPVAVVVTQIRKSEETLSENTQTKKRKENYMQVIPEDLTVNKTSSIDDTTEKIFKTKAAMKAYEDKLQPNTCIILENLEINNLEAPEDVGMRTRLRSKSTDVQHVAHFDRNRSASVDFNALSSSESGQNDSKDSSGFDESHESSISIDAASSTDSVLNKQETSIPEPQEASILTNHVDEKERPPETVEVLPKTVEVLPTTAEVPVIGSPVTEANVSSEPPKETSSDDTEVSGKSTEEERTVDKTKQLVDNDALHSDVPSKPVDEDESLSVPTKLPDSDDTPILPPEHDKKEDIPEKNDLTVSEDVVMVESSTSSKDDEIKNTSDKNELPLTDDTLIPKLSASSEHTDVKKNVSSTLELPVTNDIPSVQVVKVTLDTPEITDMEKEPADLLKNNQNDNTVTNALIVEKENVPLKNDEDTLTAPTNVVAEMTVTTEPKPLVKDHSDTPTTEDTPQTKRSNDAPAKNVISKKSTERSPKSKTSDGAKGRSLENTIKKMKEKIEESEKAKKESSVPSPKAADNVNSAEGSPEKSSLPHSKEIQDIKSKDKTRRSKEPEKTKESNSVSSCKDVEKVNSVEKLSDVDSKPQTNEVQTSKDKNESEKKSHKKSDEVKHKSSEVDKKETKRKRSRSRSKSRVSDKKSDSGADKEKSSKSSTRSSSKSRSLDKRSKHHSDSESDRKRRSKSKSLDKDKNSTQEEPNGHKTPSKSKNSEGKTKHNSSERPSKHRSSESKEKTAHSEDKKDHHKKRSSKSPPKSKSLDNKEKQNVEKRKNEEKEKSKDKTEETKNKSDLNRSENKGKAKVEETNDKLKTSVEVNKDAKNTTETTPKVEHRSSKSKQKKSKSQESNSRKVDPGEKTEDKVSEKHVQKHKSQNSVKTSDGIQKISEKEKHRDSDKAKSKEKSQETGVKPVHNEKQNDSQKKDDKNSEKPRRSHSKEKIKENSSRSDKREKSSREKHREDKKLERSIDAKEPESKRKTKENEKIVTDEHKQETKSEKKSSHQNDRVVADNDKNKKEIGDFNTTVVNHQSHHMGDVSKNKQETGQKGVADNSSSPPNDKRPIEIPKKRKYELVEENGNVLVQEKRSDSQPEAKIAKIDATAVNAETSQQKPIEPIKQMNETNVMVPVTPDERPSAEIEDIQKPPSPKMIEDKPLEPLQNALEISTTDISYENFASGIKIDSVTMHPKDDEASTITPVDRNEDKSDAVTVPKTPEAIPTDNNILAPSVVTEETHSIDTVAEVPAVVKDLPPVVHSQEKISSEEQTVDKTLLAVTTTEEIDSSEVKTCDNKSKETDVPPTVKERPECPSPVKLLLQNEVPLPVAQPVFVNTVFSSSQNIDVRVLATPIDSTVKHLPGQDADLSLIPSVSSSVSTDCITTTAVSMSCAVVAASALERAPINTQQEKTCLFAFNEDAETVNRENLGSSDIFHTPIELDDISPTKLPLASNQSLDFISPSTSIAEISNSMNLVQTLGTSTINFVPDTSEIDMQQTNKQSSFGPNFVTRVTEISCFVEKESNADHNYTLGDPLLGGNNEDKNILTTGLSLSNSPEEFQLNESHLEDLSFNENNFIEENGTLEELALFLPCKKEKPDFVCDNIIDEPILKPEDIQNSIKRLNMLVDSSQSGQQKTISVDNTIEHSSSNDCSVSLGIDYAVSKLLGLGGGEVTSQNNSFPTIPDIDNINIMESTVLPKQTMEEPIIETRDEPNILAPVCNNYASFIPGDNQKVVVEPVEQYSITSVDQLKKDYMNDSCKVEEKSKPVKPTAKAPYRPSKFATFLESLKKDAVKNENAKAKDDMENYTVRRHNRTPVFPPKQKTVTQRQHTKSPPQSKKNEVLSFETNTNKTQNAEVGKEGRIRVKTDLVKIVDVKEPSESLSSLEYINEHDHDIASEVVLPFSKPSPSSLKNEVKKVDTSSKVDTGTTKHARFDKMGNDYIMENILNVRTESHKSPVRDAKPVDKGKKIDVDVNKKRKPTANDDVKRDDKRLKKSEDDAKPHPKKADLGSNSKQSNDDIFDKLLREGPVNKVFAQRMNEQGTKKESQGSSADQLKSRGYSTVTDTNKRSSQPQSTSAHAHESSRLKDVRSQKKPGYHLNSNPQLDRRHPDKRNIAVPVFDTSPKRHVRSHPNSYSSKSDPCTTRDYKTRDRRMSTEHNPFPNSSRSELRHEDEFSWIDKFSGSGLFDTPSGLFTAPGSKRQDASSRK